VSGVRSRRGAALLVLALISTLGLAGCGGSRTDSEAPVANVSIEDDDGLHGVVLPRPYAVPAITLEDAAGEPYDVATEPSKPLTLVFFGYTHCPDICQVVMANIASALTRLDAEQREQVGMLFVTTDPARDDAATLRAYLDRFDRSFDGLTGDLPDIVRFGKAFGVFIEKGQKLPSGGYDVNHSTQVVGMLPERRAPFVWTEGTAPAALADDISRILQGKVRGL
jgi:protein SCO1/2